MANHRLQRLHRSTSDNAGRHGGIEGWIVLGFHDLKRRLEIPPGELNDKEWLAAIAKTSTQFLRGRGKPIADFMEGGLTGRIQPCGQRAEEFRL